MLFDAKETQWDWRKPELTRAGQTMFWDRQSQTYDTADMTNDNEGEMDAVLECLRTTSFREIVTLGGAVGCRDPKMILESIFCEKGANGNPCSPKKVLPDIVFNDLSPSQVERAKTNILSRCNQSCGVRVEFFSGPIMETCKRISGTARTLLLGIYDVEAFFRADEEHGYPMAGFDEYLKNANILGDRFWFDWLTLNGDSVRIMNSGMRLHISESSESKAEFRRKLYGEHSVIAQPYGDADEPLRFLALQVVSVHDGKSGYFVSHWYSTSTVIDLLTSVFPLNAFEISQMSFPKGTLFCIKRRNVASQGVVTMLNNVFGNIIPSEQIATLEAIRSII